MAGASFASGPGLLVGSPEQHRGHPPSRALRPPRAFAWRTAGDRRRAWTACRRRIGHGLATDFRVWVAGNRALGRDRNPNRPGGQHDQIRVRSSGARVDRRPPRAGGGLRCAGPRPAATIHERSISQDRPGSARRLEGSLRCALGAHHQPTPTGATTRLRSSQPGTGALGGIDDVPAALHR